MRGFANLLILLFVLGFHGPVQAKMKCVFYFSRSAEETPSIDVDRLIRADLNFSTLNVNIESLQARSYYYTPHFQGKVLRALEKFRLYDETESSRSDNLIGRIRERSKQWVNTQKAKLAGIYWEPLSRMIREVLAITRYNLLEEPFVEQILAKDPGQTLSRKEKEALDAVIEQSLQNLYMSMDMTTLTVQLGEKARLENYRGMVETMKSYRLHFSGQINSQLPIITQLIILSKPHLASMEFFDVMVQEVTAPYLKRFPDAHYAEPSLAWIE